MAVKPVPDGYHTVTPYLTVADAAAEIDFLKRAFNAQQVYAHTDSKGNVSHAELRIGDSMVMIGQANGPWTPKHANFYLYVPNVDELYKQAVAAGGKSISEPSDQFYGDRHGGVEDSNGNGWWIATHIEDVAPEEIQRRAAEYEKKRAASQSK